MAKIIMPKSYIVYQLVTCILNKKFFLLLEDKIYAVYLYRPYGIIKTYKQKKELT